MKKLCLALLIAGVFCGRGTAQDLYWDMDPANAGATPSGTSATGTWNATNTNWNSDSGGAAGVTLGTWVSGRKAIFSAGGDATGASTITVDGTQTASGVLIEEGTITVANGVSPGTIDVVAEVHNPQRRNDAHY